MFYFHFHFFGHPIESHVLFTLSLSRYSMFPYCFLCWNSQRKASQLASAPWALLRRQSASRPQRLSLFLHLETLCLPLSGIRRGTGLGLSAFMSFFLWILNGNFQAFPKVVEPEAENPNCNNESVICNWINSDWNLNSPLSCMPLCQQ